MKMQEVLDRITKIMKREKIIEKRVINIEGPDKVILKCSEGISTEEFNAFTEEVSSFASRGKVLVLRPDIEVYIIKGVE